MSLHLVDQGNEPLNPTMDANERADQLKVLLAAGQQITALRSLRDVLQSITDHMHQSMKYDSVILFPYTAKKGRFERPVYSGHLKDPQKVIDKLDGDELLDKLIAEKDKLIEDHGDFYHFTDHARSDPLIGGKFTAREGVEASGFVGLTIGDELVGILFTNIKNEYHFDQAEIDAVRLFANLAAIAIHNTQQYELLRSEQGRMEMALWATQQVKTSMSLGEELQEILNRLVEEHGYDLVSLHRYDPFTREMGHPLLAGRFNNYAAAAGLDHLVPGTLLYRRLFELPNLYLADEVSKDPNLKDSQFVRREQVVSSASIRLRFKNQTWGVLFANLRTPCVFGQREIGVLKSEAYRAASALHRAWLSRQSSERMGLVASIGMRAGQSLELGDVLETLYTQLQSVFGDDVRPGVLLYQNRELHFIQSKRFGFRVDIDEQKDRNKLTLEEGLCGWVAKHKQAVLVPDVDQDKRYLRLLSTTRSELAVPLKSGKRLIGVLDLESPHLNHFNQDDQLFMEAVSRQIVAAIQNALHYSELQEKRRQADAFRKSARTISDSLESPYALEAILEQAMQLTGAYVGAIQVRRGNGLYFVSVLPEEMNEYVRNKFGDYLPMDGLGLTVEACRTGNILCHNNIDESVKYIPGTDRKINSELVVPIEIKGTVWGVINVEHTDKDVFTDDHIQAIKGLSTLAAIAIQAADFSKRQAEEHHRAEKHRIYVKHTILRSSWLHTYGSKASIARDLLRSAILHNDRGDYETVLEKLREGYSRITDLASSINEDWKKAEEEPVQEIGLESLIKERTREWESFYSNAQIKLLPPLPVGVFVRVQPTQLKVVLDSLVSNAVNAVCKSRAEIERVVTIQCAEENEKIVLLISDNGTGIPENILKILGSDVIEKNRGETGWGLGCLLSSLLVEEMQGVINWKNKPQGGAEARLVLPISSLQGS